MCYFIAAYLCVGCKELLVHEFIERVIAMQEGVCAVPDCKDKPSFGPILMSNDLTFK
jgi:hypothetical protein